MIPVALRALERFLLPNMCVACDSLVGARTPDALMCAACRTRMRRLPGGPGVCTRCQQPLPPVGPCRFCRGWTPELAWAVSAVWLGTEARSLIHALKYEGRRGLATLAAEIVAAHTPKPRCRWLMPVPVGRRRLRDRGYNQAALIARALSKRWQLPMAEGALRRVRETGTQTALTPEARLANVAGAFMATGPPTHLQKRHAPRREEPAQAVLVDDVLTTGATVDAAARALAAANWTVIGAITFARTMPYEVSALSR